MNETKGKVTSVNGNLVSVEFNGNVSMKEICYVLVDDKALKSEVIRIKGNIAQIQVYEMTGGIKGGDEVEFSVPFGDGRIRLVPGHGELVAVLMDAAFDLVFAGRGNVVQLCGTGDQRGIVPQIEHVSAGTFHRDRDLVVGAGKDHQALAVQIADALQQDGNTVLLLLTCA